MAIASQSQLTYTETFSDIANWTFGTGGTFSAGVGAASWKGNATNATGIIPDGVRISASTLAFAASTSSGGLHKGTGNVQLLSTGTTDNTTSTAIDFFLDFTGVNALTNLKITYLSDSLN